MKNMKRTFFRWLQVIFLLLVVCCLLIGCTCNKVMATKNVSNLNEEIIPDPLADTAKFYYNQLNETEKEIYNIISDSKEIIIDNGNFWCAISLKNEYDTYVNYIRRAVDAFRYDNPDARIYFTRYAIATECNNDHYDYYDFYIQPHTKCNMYADFSSGELRKMLEELETTTQEFVETLSGSDEDKLIKIHDWLIDNAAYDETHNLPNTNNAYGAIIEKNSVCGGYAYAFKYISDMAGLDVLFATGNTYSIEDKEPSFHAWNYAYVDGKWLIIDVTWDISLKKYTFFKKSRYLLLAPEKERESGIIRECHNEFFMCPN